MINHPRLAGLLVLCACSGGASDATSPTSPPLAPARNFSFSSFAEHRVDLRVLQDGVPLQGATVSIASVRGPESNGAAQTFGRAVTDLDGRCALPLRVPTDLRDVDLVVHAPGSSGPYSHEELRAADGPCAVSSRTTHAVTALDGVVLRLQQVMR